MTLIPEHPPQPPTDEATWGAPVPEPIADAAKTVPEEPPQNQETTQALAPFVSPSVPKQTIEGDPPNEPLTSAPEGTLPLLFMPSATDAVLTASQEHLPQGYSRDPRWAAVLDSADQLSSNGEFEPALARSGSNWERKVVHGNSRLNAQAITMPSVKGKEISGDQALMSFRAHSRASAGAGVYFWSSGVSAKFNAMSNERMYHLQREVASSRITAGRATYGMALSQHMVYTVEAVLEAARDVLFKSSLAEGVDLGDAIRITDFHTLVWALAVATFPQGFDIERGCVADPGNCNHSVKDRLAVRRMQVVDHNAISDEQRVWLVQLQEGRSTLEELEKYQTLFPRLPKKAYELKHGSGRTTTLNLRVPTLNEYIRDGKMWVDEVNRAVVQSIGEKASFNERNEMMTELMQVANARQYSHWVESLGFDEGKIVDQPTLRRLLGEEISSEDQLLADFMKAVRDFNEAMAVSVIAINNFKCPVCHKYQMVVKGHEGEETQPPTYVPVEAMSTFFALMYQKLAMAPT